VMDNKMADVLDLASDLAEKEVVIDDVTPTVNLTNKRNTTAQVWRYFGLRLLDDQILHSQCYTITLQ
jgi:hypothetical protein